MTLLDKESINLVYHIPVKRTLTLNSFCFSLSRDARLFLCNFFLRHYLPSPLPQGYKRKLFVSLFRILPRTPPQVSHFYHQLGLLLYPFHLCMEGSNKPLRADTTAPIELLLKLLLFNNICRISTWL